MSFSQDQTLDEVGNWTSFNQDNTGDGTNNLVQTRTNNKANEITGITNTTGGAWTSPTYDLVGNTTKTPSVEAPTDSGKDRQLTYDAWNRVVKVTDSSTSGFDPNTLAFYEYDARGFRVTNQRYSGVGTAADWLTHYYYTTSWQCIEERVVDLTVTPTPAAQLSAQYVWGLRYVDDLIQRQKDTTGNGTLDETLYAINDRQFNIVALTDTSQSVVQRMSYTPYGEVKFLTNAYASSTNTKEWEQLFQGLRLDQTGLYDNRRRILDALTGRFVQNDPLDYPDGMNRYAAYHVMYGSLDSTGSAIQLVVGGVVISGGALKTAAGILGLAGAAACLKTPECVELAIQITRETIEDTVSSAMNWLTKPKRVRAMKVRPRVKCPKGRSGTRDKNCSDNKLRRLTAMVDHLCHGTTACHEGMTCAELKARALMFAGCKAVREWRDKACWNGGDSGHKKARKAAGEAAGNCWAIYSRKPDCGGNSIIKFFIDAT
ncbi:MAG: RHS repeat-associated core domain-containing protein [Planctomycetota bacterium]